MEVFSFLVYVAILFDLVLSNSFELRRHIDILNALECHDPTGFFIDCFLTANKTLRMFDELCD